MGRSIQGQRKQDQRRYEIDYIQGLQFMWLENIARTMPEEKDKRKKMLKFHRAKSKVSNTTGKGGKPQRNIKPSFYNDKNLKTVSYSFSMILGLGMCFIDAKYGIT